MKEEQRAKRYSAEKATEERADKFVQQLVSGTEEQNQTNFLKKEKVQQGNNCHRNLIKKKKINEGISRHYIICPGKQKYFTIGCFAPGDV